MSLIKRYIAREFLLFFFICSLSLIIIAIVFSSLAELPNLKKENGLELFISAVLSGIPLLVEVVVPISVLLATVLAFISLSRTSEIVAMMAAGVSLLHLVIPVVICGLFIGGLLYLNQSYLAPLWGSDERTGLVTKTQITDLWRLHDQTLYYFASPDKSRRTVKMGRSFVFSNDLHITESRVDEGLSQSDSGWLIDQRKSFAIGENSVRVSSAQDRFIPSDQFPIVFNKTLVNPKYSSITELMREMQIKKNSALNYKSDLFALFQKVSGQISIFVMILLALPFSIYSGRSANVRTGIVISIVLGFIFFLADQILLSFHSTGSTPAFVSAFGANALFLTLAMLLIRLKRA